MRTIIVVLLLCLLVGRCDAGFYKYPHHIDRSNLPTVPQEPPRTHFPPPSAPIERPTPISDPATFTVAGSPVHNWEFLETDAQDVSYWFTYVTAESGNLLMTIKLAEKNLNGSWGRVVFTDFVITCNQDDNPETSILGQVSFDAASGEQTGQRRAPDIYGVPVPVQPRTRLAMAVLASCMLRHKHPRL